MLGATSNFTLDPSVAKGRVVFSSCLGGLSGGAKAGIAVGVIAGVALLGVVGWFGYRKVKDDSSEATPFVHTSFTNPMSSAYGGGNDEGRVDISFSSNHSS